MIRYKVFTGTIEEIETAFNAWAASLPPGVNINAGPLVLAGNPDNPLAEKLWMKEVVYVLPARSNGAIAVPEMPNRAERRRGA